MQKKTVEKNKVAIISNLWTMMISMEIGDVHEGHSHTFDHTHLLTNGKVKITIDGKESIFESPTQIMIKRGLAHSMECLSDKSVGWCIHAIRNGNRVEDIFDPALCPDYLDEAGADAVFPRTALVMGAYEESEPKPWGELSGHDNPKVAKTT